MRPFFVRVSSAFAALVLAWSCGTEEPAETSAATGTGAGAGEGGSGGAAPVDDTLDLGGGVTVSPRELQPGGEVTIVYQGALAG